MIGGALYPRYVPLISRTCDYYFNIHSINTDVIGSGKKLKEESLDI